MRGTVAKRLKRQARKEFVETGQPTNLRYRELKKLYKTKPPVNPKFKQSRRVVRKLANIYSQ